jgi:hypothetical protein
MELTLFNNVQAIMKSSLNYNEEEMSRHQEEIKPKYKFFREILLAL